jgi:hypothetical protein
MKKWICIAIVLVVVAFGAEARSQAEWDAFVAGGLTRGSLSGGSEGLLGEDTRYGFNIGLRFQLRMDQLYGFEAGVRYTRKGGGGTIDSTFAIATFKDVTRAIGSADITLDYVEIPVVFVVFGNLSENSYLRGYIGPSVNILTRARMEGVIDHSPIDHDIKSDLQATQVSGVLGAGYTYEFEGWRLALDVRYWQGITKLVDGPDIKTREFDAGVAVGIPLARD